jgi:hypothetical protein
MYEPSIIGGGNYTSMHSMMRNNATERFVGNKQSEIQIDLTKIPINRNSISFKNTDREMNIKYNSPDCLNYNESSQKIKDCSVDSVCERNDRSPQKSINHGSMNF